MYTFFQDSVEVQENTLGEGLKVLVIDDLLATGGTLSASVQLLQQAGYEVVGCLVVMEIKELKGRDKIEVPIKSLIEVQHFGTFLGQHSARTSFRILFLFFGGLPPVVFLSDFLASDEFDVFIGLTRFFDQRFSNESTSFSKSRVDSSSFNIWNKILGVGCTKNYIFTFCLLTFLFISLCSGCFFDGVFNIFTIQNIEMQRVTIYRQENSIFSGNSFHNINNCNFE